MANKTTSPLQFDALCVLGVIALGVAGLHANEAGSEDASSVRVLTEYFRVERLPASARNIQCLEEKNPCDPTNYSTKCYVRIEPGDFELLAKQGRFIVVDDCPANFSYTHMQGLKIGPNFRINESRRGGTDSAIAEVFPDAAHGQFVALLYRPSRSSIPLHCNY